MSHVIRCSIALCLPLILLTPLHAHAAGPTRQVTPINSSFTSPPGGFLNPCNQPLSIVETGILYTTSYYDKQGNLVRQLQTTPQMTFTFTGPTGITLVGKSPAPAHYYYSGNTVTVVGNGEQLRVTIPGTGSVYSLSGNQSETFDLTTGQMLASSFSGEMKSNATAFCSYLGAN